MPRWSRSESFGHRDWTLRVPILLFAGIVARLPQATLVRRPTSAPRLVVEAFAGTLAVISAGGARQVLLCSVRDFGPFA